MLIPILYLLCTLFITGEIHTEILIITSVYNQPDFIEYQNITFKKFLLEEYRFVVFNDAPTESMRASINNMCAKLKIQCIAIPQEIHSYAYLPREPEESLQSPSVRCSTAIQYGINTIGVKHNDLLMVIDSDIFLVKPFSLKKYMHEHNIAGLPQSRDNNIHYLWIGLLFLDMSQLPNKKTINVNCGRIDGTPVDAGGYIHHYIKDNPSLKIKYFGVLHSDSFEYDTEWLKKHNFDSNAIQFIMRKTHNIEFMLEGTFMHYRGGTNWDHKSNAYHITKKQLLSEYITQLISG